MYMRENEISKKIYFWVTGEKFEADNIDRIYNEMKYNFYLPSDLANGLSEHDYGAITNTDLHKTKEFAKNKLNSFEFNNSFCYVIEKEYSFTAEEWQLLIDKEGNVNLSKLGMNEFPEFQEPTYSISKDGSKEEENTIHIKTPEEINSTVLDLVTSDYNTGFRLLNKIYEFSENTNLFDNYTDLEKLNKAIQQKNVNNLTKVQKLDKLGKSLESIIPLKIICYMISDTKLLLGNKKEYSTKDIENNRKEYEKSLEDFNKEKAKLIREFRDFSRKVGINIENIFDQNGELLDRKFTIDNAKFMEELTNMEIEEKGRNYIKNETQEDVIGD